jgi:hypothetical protein
MAEERRRAVLFLSEDMVRAMLKLPDDVRILGIKDDFLRMGVQVLFEGNRFPTCPEGMYPYEVQAKYIMVPDENRIEVVFDYETEDSTQHGSGT